MSDFNPLVLIGTGSSLAFSALFYSLYKTKQDELRKLRVSSFCLTIALTRKLASIHLRKDFDLYSLNVKHIVVIIVVVIVIVF